MTNKTWTAVGESDATNIMSEEALSYMAEDIEKGKVENGYCFCDCEYADTDWEVTDFQKTAEGTSVTLVHMWDSVVSLTATLIYA